METKLEKFNNEYADLMRQWKSRHKSAGYRSFVSDGVLCPEIWFSQTTRILFILKEAYSVNQDDDIDWNLLDYLNSIAGSKGRIWSAIAEWQHALDHTTKESIPIFDNWLGCTVGDMPQYRKVKCDLLRKCAIINIKKSNGRNGSADSDLLEYIQKDWDLLKKQIEIIDPTIIVCGSTFHLLKDCPKDPVSKRKLILGADTSSLSQDRGCKRIGDTTVIAYYHPANQYPAALNYYGISGMYHSYLREEKEKYEP